VQQRINILPGVSQVQIFGVKSAIRIKADPAALAARNMTLDELSAAIRSGTSYAGAGQFDGKTKSFVLRPNAQIADAEGYRNLIIARGPDNTPIYLRDVAQVTDSVQDERLSRHFFARGFTPPASTIVMAVSRQAGANAVEVATSIRELLPQLRLELPGSINLIPTFDRAKTIERSVHDVQETLLIAFVLVILVIFIFLGRAADTMIPVVALPLSLLITFLAMWALGFSINNLTLMALTLAIGFLVDDAIVFLENVVRRAEAGESIYKATLNSAGEISFTILSMTLSLAAVFIPLVFMPGLLGRIFREFAITIIVAIVASGVVSLTLTPLMCARMLKERGPGTRRPGWKASPSVSSIPSCASIAGRSIGSSITDGSQSRRSSSAPSAFGISSPRCRSRFCLPAIAARSEAIFSFRRAPRRSSNARFRTSWIRSCRRIPRSISTSPLLAAGAAVLPVSSRSSS
jgi:HAE1 family hydrophobic/amphiphilic exporter-1